MPSPTQRGSHSQNLNVLSEEFMHIAYDNLEREETNLVEVNSFHNPVICVEIMVYVVLVYNKYKNISYLHSGISKF